MFYFSCQTFHGIIGEHPRHNRRVLDGCVSCSLEHSVSRPSLSRSRIGSHRDALQGIQSRLSPRSQLALHQTRLERPFSTEMSQRFAVGTYRWYLGLTGRERGSGPTCVSQKVHSCRKRCILRHVLLLLPIRCLPSISCSGTLKTLPPRSTAARPWAGLLFLLRPPPNEFARPAVLWHAKSMKNHSRQALDITGVPMKAIDTLERLLTMLRAKPTKQTIGRNIEFPVKHGRVIGSIRREDIYTDVA